MALSKIRNDSFEDTAVHGVRNLIINGAMNVAQRSTSETGLGGSSGYFTLDRFKAAVTSSGRFTMAQTAITDLPGFANALHLDCTTADTSIDAAENLVIQHKFEGQDLQRLQKGTSSAKPVTVSFYAKANAAFTFVVELYDLDNTRNITQKFTTSTSWTRHTLTFPADTSGAFDDDNAASMNLSFWLHAGTTFGGTGGTFLDNTWGTPTNANRTSGISSFFSSTDNDLKITGVQLEVGTATPFEHRIYGDELARCQRYYYQTQTSEHSVHANRSYNNGNTYYGTVTFPSTMRATPTFSAQTNTIQVPSISNTTGTFGTYNLTRHRGIISIIPASDFGAYTYTVVAINNAMKFDAEL